VGRLQRLQREFGKTPERDPGAKTPARNFWRLREASLQERTDGRGGPCFCLRVKEILVCDL
jgi:hypothetical protein